VIKSNVATLQNTAIVITARAAPIIQGARDLQVVLGIDYWETVMILSGSFSPGEKPGPSTGSPRIADVKIQAALVGSPDGLVSR